MKKTDSRRAFLGALAWLWLLLFVPATAQGQANPFTSKSDSTSLSSVRVSQPVAELSRLQTSLRDGLADFFYAWKDQRSAKVLVAVLGLAFLYGILHALGPGHRKMVVFSLFLARPSTRWEPLVIGLLLSMLHAGSSVVIMLVLRGVTGAISGISGQVSLIMEGIAYSALVLMSLLLLAHSLSHLRHRKPAGEKILGLGTLLVTGIYPCPGAILILILSVSLDMMGLGFLAVAAMSVGMSLPIIAMGYLAALGRTRLVSMAIENKRRLSLLSGSLEIAGYAFLFAFSLFIAFPFLASLPKLFG